MSKRVLLIDDDEEMCAELREILTDEGYEVQICLDGHKGREALEEGQYEAVILDLKLPGLNGYEILKSVRAQGCQAKIIVLSGRPLTANQSLIPQSYAQIQEEHILKLADAVMNKPVAVPSLLDKVRSFVLSSP